MSNHDVLAAVADGYNPLLAACALGVLGWRFARDRAQARAVGWLLLRIVVVVYALMAIDRAIRATGWHGVHYSTHSGFALAMAAFIGRHVPASRIPIAASVAAYLVLIVHLGFHSTADVMLTLLLAGPPIAWLAWKARPAPATPEPGR